MPNIVTIDGLPVYQALVDGDDTGMLRVSLVDDPAVQSNFLAFEAQHPQRRQLYAVADEERRLVRGVVMRADFPIYRRTKQRGEDFEYYIIYKADTIRKMAEKYLMDSRQNNVDLMHDSDEVEGVNMVQFFIKGDGVAVDGFDDCADGSLLAEYHVTDDAIWEDIKAGKYKGFSLEGVFDLVPETDKDYTQEVVDRLDGIFKRILNAKQYEQMKKKGLIARLAAMLVELGTVSTDKGVLAWDGDEDLKAGDSVYIEDQDGNRTAAADGDYTTEDGKVIVVVDGKVSELRDPAAQVASEPAATEPEENQAMGSVETDNGLLEWDGEEDLKEGDAVYITDETGNRTAAPDGEYTTADGKVITVAEGVVSAITDPQAEVEAARQQRMEACRARVEKMSASYTDKFRAIGEAIAATGVEDFYIDDAGDDFAVICAWDEEWNDHYYRYAVTWNEDGTANVADPVEVKLMFVPLDFVSPFEGETAEMQALRSECEALRSEVEQLKATPAAAPAHQEVKASIQVGKTGVKGLDRLAKIMGA